jgi:branched-chain amino acid aminotransferase
MTGNNALIWIDGEMVPHNEAKVHFLSPALHYGLAAFEGIRCYETQQGPIPTS